MKNAPPVRMRALVTPHSKRLFAAGDLPQPDTKITGYFSERCFQWQVAHMPGALVGLHVNQQNVIVPVNERLVKGGKKRQPFYEDAKAQGEISGLRAAYGANKSGLVAVVKVAELHAAMQAQKYDSVQDFIEQYNGRYDDVPDGVVRLTRDLKLA